MMTPQITIALVKYPGLDDGYFRSSLYSALAQIGCDVKVKVFLDDTDYRGREDIDLITVPKVIAGNPAKIRQYMIEQTDTPFLSFWDSDDVFSVSRVHDQLQTLKEKDLDVCFGDVRYFDEKEVYAKTYFDLIGIESRDIDIFNENYIPFGNITARTDFLKSLLPFPDVHMLDWWIGIKCRLMGAKVGYCDSVTAYYRVHDGSISKRFKAVEKDDFKREQASKIEVYELFENISDEFKNKLNFFRSINVDDQFAEMKSKFEGKTYQNILGGLIDYEGQ